MSVRGPTYSNSSMIRLATSADLEAIAAIEAGSPEAARWSPEHYLQYRCTVAESNGKAAGFLVTRQTAPGESEILNLVVAKHCRRQGVAGRLLAEALKSAPGEWFLEVRKSNIAAILLYERMGFTMVSERPEYYHQPIESAIVMKRRS
jgi:ribosomal-protein-alanine acetyltransferase